MIINFIKRIFNLELLLISISITLYLSPTKELIASLILFLLFLYNLIIRKNIFYPCKYFIPLILIIGYALSLAVFYDTPIPYEFLKKIIIGGFILLFSINLFSKNYYNSRLSFFYIMLLPGLVHIAYLYYDIFRYSIQTTNFLWEHLKDVPRVGRRYISTSTLSLMLSFFIMGGYSKKLTAKLCSLVGFGIAMISMAILDARAGYIVSVMIFIGPLVFRKTRILYFGFVRNWQTEFPYFYPIVLCIFTLTLVVGYKTGEERWGQFYQSISLAIESNQTSSGYRKNYLASQEFWNKDYSKNDLTQCIREKQERCIVDQSAYLRSHWFINSLKVLKKYPLGLGYRPEMTSSLQSSEVLISNQPIFLGGAGDCFIVETILSFGVIGLLLYGWFFSSGILPYYMGNELLKKSPLGTAFFLVSIASILRMTIDAFGEGLWTYFMIFFGALLAQIIVRKDRGT
jgi:hypothetical protein